MIVALFVYIVLLLLIAKKKQERHIAFIVFTGYLIYMFFTHQYVKNPYSDYFIGSDQITFYELGVDLSVLPFSEIFAYSRDFFRTQESPLGFSCMAYLIKFANLLHVSDTLFFMKTNVVFLGTLVHVFIYKIYGQIVPVVNERITKRILIFAFLSPIFLLSCQIMRDVHVCLLYTVLVYLAMKREQKGRLLLMFFLVIVTYYFRTENGLFAVAFFAIPMSQMYKQVSGGGKLFIFALSLLVLVSISGFILSTMVNVIAHYTILSVDVADAGSLGVKLNELPVPFNFLAKTFFAQLLPFPVWALFKETHSYNHLVAIDCLFPFYWLPILIAIFCNWFKERKKWPIKISLLFYLSILYLIVASASEFNTRRLMVVYPFIFLIYQWLRYNYKVKATYYGKYVAIGILLLHVAYMVIK